MRLSAPMRYCINDSPFRYGISNGTRKQVELVTFVELLCYSCANAEYHIRVYSWLFYILLVLCYVLSWFQGGRPLICFWIIPLVRGQHLCDANLINISPESTLNTKWSRRHQSVGPGGTIGCHKGNLWHRLWQQSAYNDNSRFPSTWHTTNNKNNATNRQNRRLCNISYGQVSYVRGTLVGNTCTIVDPSYVVGAAPVSAAPTTSSFAT